MNFMTASIVLEVKADKARSELKAVEKVATKSAKETDKINKIVARNVVKGFKSHAREAEKANKTAARVAEKAARAAEKAHAASIKKIKKALRSMEQTAKDAFSSMAKIAKWACLAIVGALTLVTRAAMKQEDASFLLNASLKISGEYTDKLAARFKNFAAEVQQATIYGDEFVLQLMQQQKSLGVSADKLENSAKMAIGLATATGQGVESMSRYVALAQQGEFTMLRRYIPALRATTDATEQLAIVQKFASDGYKLAEERAKTTSGALRQMWNTIGDVAERIGNAFLPMIRRASDTIKEWARNNQEKIGKFADVIAEKFEFVWHKVVGLIKLITTDFSKGMGVLKDIAVSILEALVDSFVIAGIAAGKALWRGIGMGKPSKGDVWKTWIEEGNLGPPIDILPADYGRIERKLMVEQLKEEVGIVDQLKAAWERAGVAMSNAIPTPSEDTMAPPQPAVSGLGITELPFTGDMSFPSIPTEEERWEAQQEAYNTQLGFLEDIKASEAQRAALNKKYTEEDLKGLNSSAAALGAWVKQSMNWGKQLGQMFGSMLDGISKNIATALVDGTAQFGNFFKDMLKMLLALIAKLLIAATLKAFVMGTVVPALGAGSGIGNAFASVFGGKQTGGYIEKTGYYKMHAGEKVQTKSEVAAATPTTVNIINNVGAGITLEQEENIKDSVTEIIIERSETNGDLRAALGIL